ncbi:hypothetical protein ATHL_00980 [Anaerolinea thermolimosa]|uniref:hypothetical protein n=1 Tax=Anaerolinea thermolimosa TaxID=229919 RepID=UPI000780D09B|nr:hypothetical protein [Anaerolinea thermolimosa]GAP06134.1 hypothetical protein ATHL_00980 [Anaerolinea thermolimosa]
MWAIARINKQIVNGFVILAVLLSLLPAAAPVSSKALSQAKQGSSDRIRYGSEWYTLPAAARSTFCWVTTWGALVW